MDTELHKELKIIRAACIALQKQQRLLKQEESLLLQILPTGYPTFHQPVTEPDADLLALLSPVFIDEEHPFSMEMELL
jgi:hypothetical protein